MLHGTLPPPLMTLEKGPVPSMYLPTGASVRVRRDDV